MTQSDRDLKQVDVYVCLISKSEDRQARAGLVSAESLVTPILRGQPSCSSPIMKLQPSHPYSKKQGRKEREKRQSTPKATIKQYHLTLLPGA